MITEAPGTIRSAELTMKHASSDGLQLRAGGSSRRRGERGEHVARTGGARRKEAEVTVVESMKPTSDVAGWDRAEAARGAAGICNEPCDELLEAWQLEVADTEGEPLTRPSAGAFGSEPRSARGHDARGEDSAVESTQLAPTVETIPSDPGVASSRWRVGRRRTQLLELEARLAGFVAELARVEIEPGGFATAPWMLRQVAVFSRCVEGHGAPAGIDGAEDDEQPTIHELTGLHRERACKAFVLVAMVGVAAAPGQAKWR